MLTIRNWPPEGGVIRVGSGVFAESMQEQGANVYQVKWQPPAHGKAELIDILDELEGRSDIDKANQTAIERFSSAQPVLTGIGVAREAIPGFGDRMLLHAGPPITWGKMSGPLRGAVIGAILYEGWADSPEKAEELASKGDIEYSPCHEHSAVGPMAGVVSPRMPVFILENRTHGNRSYSTLNEGLGKVLRYGAYSEEVLDRLRWMEKVLAPILKKAIELSGGIDLKSMIAQALHMGDEVHNRNRAGTSLLIRALVPYLVEVDHPQADIRKCLEFVNSNDHFFLNLSMPAVKAMLEAAHGIHKSSVVTIMARNGTEFGIKVSGLGNQWFTGPAEIVKMQTLISVTQR